MSTPKTNAVMDNMYRVNAPMLERAQTLLEFARELERELAEARAELVNKDEALAVAIKLIDDARNSNDGREALEEFDMRPIYAAAALAQGGKENT